MAKISIYADLEDASIHFDGSTIDPQPLATCTVVAHPTEADRLVIKSTILKPNGNERTFFRRIHINRVKNKDGERLTQAPYNYDQAQVVSYLVAEFTKTLGTETASYRGVWDASTNTPDLTTLEPENGDFLWVTVAGTFDGDDYEVNDQVRYSLGNNDWQRIANMNASVASIESAALGVYDLHVDPSFTGVPAGSNLRPYTTIADALAQSSAGDNILVKGTNVITSEIVIPHGVNLFGAPGASVGYASYNAANGNVFKFTGTDYTQSLLFKDLIIHNAGGYGIHTQLALKVTVEDCTLTHNGWNGTGLNTVLDSATSGVLGFDSTNTDLQAFYAGANASNGGAMRIESSPQILIVGNDVKENLRGIRVQDCGISGAGFISRNQSSNNIESGIYLAVGAGGGCQNLTVINNFSAFNANNGLLCIGGINNKFSQNEVNGNWNAGMCNWGSANLTLRDCGLFNNNRSEYNGIGNTGDAKASVQINDASSFLAVSFVTNPDARFLMEVLDTQIHYTGLGSIAERLGVYFDPSLTGFTDNAKNIVKIDDVGFIGQDYAIDMADVDTTNLRISLGDNSYQSIGEKAVREPLEGNYFELPFSNHTMQLTEVDLSLTNTGNIIIKEGVGGAVLNPYSVNELQAEAHGADIRVVLKGSKKIQFVTPVNACSIDGTMVNSVLSQALVQLNDLFTNTTGFASGGNPVTNFVLSGDDLTLTLQDGTSFTVDVTTLGVDENKFVSSGALNGSNLELTMNDASVVTIDASNMINGSGLPAISNDWFIAYGNLAGDEVEVASVVSSLEPKQPFYNGSPLEKGEEFIWTHNNTGSYILGLYTENSGNDYGYVEATYNAKWSNNFKFNRSTGTVKETSVGVDVASRFGSGYTITQNTLLALTYDTDNYLKLFDVTDGDRTLIGQSNSALVGSSQTIFFVGENQPNAKFPTMIKRLSEWTVAHDTNGTETTLTDGANQDTVLKSNLTIGPGEKVMINLNMVGRSQVFGLDYTAASSGNNNAHEDIITAIKYGTSEQLLAERGGEWTFDSNNTYHINTNATANAEAGGFWWRQDSNNAGMVSIRYQADNSLELWSEDDGERIATKDVDLDGSDIHFYFGFNETSAVNMIPSISKQTIGQGPQPVTSFAPDVSDQSFSVTESTTVGYTIALDSGSDIATMYAVDNAPSWLILNQSTGTFSGTAPAWTDSAADVIVLNCKAANPIGGITNFDVTLTVTEVTYTNTKSIEFDDGVSSYLGGNAARVTSLERSGNGSGSSDAWTIALWYKASANNNGQTIFYYGHNDVTNNGYIEIKQTNHNGLKRIRIRYGSNVNYLQLTSPSGSLTNNTWHHVMLTYDGGTTGVASGSMSSYYGRFKLYIDGTLQTTANTHSNNGYSGSITGQNFRIGKLVSGNFLKDARLNQLAIWGSDQSSNIVGLYNGGATQDISALAAGSGNMNTNYLAADHYYEIETSVTAIQDLGSSGNADLVGYNFSSSDLVTDAP